MAREVKTPGEELRIRQILIVLAALTLARGLVGAMLPLSFDEAYYWLWSKRLAAGYFDHPPLIAYVIRFGTVLFGDTEFGVRAGPFLLSVAATWAVWRGGAIVLGSPYLGGIAALLYNATLMVGVEALAATPDAPAMAASAFFLLALAEMERTGRGMWWLGAGVAGGVALLAKYTGLFLGAGAVLWLLAVPAQRRWLGTIWPYLGAAFALLLFSPTVLWNAEHGWVSFARQFGRVGGGDFAPGYLFEFLGAQIGLASPFVCVLGVAGIARIYATRAQRQSPLALVGAIMAPAILYFVWHALYDRVQGNWPSFLYPGFAIAAAAAWGWSRDGWGGNAIRYSRVAALPVALTLILVAYAQALWAVVPLEGTRDPFARLLAVGVAPLAQDVDDLRLQTGARAIITTSYAQTGWLSFYLPSPTPVVQANERERWLDEPALPSEIFDGPVLYVAETRRDLSEIFAARFAEIELVARIERRRGGRQNGQWIEDYVVYRLSGPTAPLFDELYD